MKQIMVICILIMGLLGCAGEQLPSATDSYDDCDCEDGPATSLGDAPQAKQYYATVAVILNMESDSALAEASRCVGEGLAIGLHTDLKKAKVFTTEDYQAVLTYSNMLVFFGGEDEHDVAGRVASAYVNSDIMVIPILKGDPFGEMILTVTAFDRASVKKIATVSLSGTAAAFTNGAQVLGQQLAEKIKDARVGMLLNAARVVIDFEDESKRSHQFSIDIRNLKDQPLSAGTVVFSLDNEQYGLLSPTTATVSEGNAATLFTMTKKAPNGVTATWQGQFTDQSVQATIVPRCGWLLIISGKKTFALNRARLPWMEALLGPESWLTINGESTVEGKIALGEVTENGETGMYGLGWMTEEHRSTSSFYFEMHGTDLNMDAVCQGSGSTEGTAHGKWLVYGYRSGDSITISGIATGKSPLGADGESSCSGQLGDMPLSISVPILGGEFSVLSEFNSVTLPLRYGASTTVSGTGSWLQESYTYTLTLTRAKQ